MNIDIIKEALTNSQYPENHISSVAQELIAVDESLEPLLDTWISSGAETDIMVEGFSLLELKSKYKMTYPAALLTMDWLIKEPKVAINAINKGIR